MSDETSISIYAGSGSERFAQRMCDYLGISLGRSFVKTFTEGNTFVRIEEKVRDKDVYIVQTIGINPNTEFMELLFFIDAFKRSSASSITAIIPYFSYAKGDKKDEPRVSIRARVCADCLEACGVDRIVTMDLHSPQIQGFFKKPVDHLYGKGVLLDYIKSRNLEDIIIVSPDVGFAKSARLYANDLRAPVAIGDKTRRDHSEKAEVLDIIGDVRGKNAVIVDDFTITCGSLADTARALIANGAKSVMACVSHSLLCENGIKCLEDSPIYELVTTDTVENAFMTNHPKITIVSAAPLFAKATEIIHNRGSLGDLF